MYRQYMVTFFLPFEIQLLNADLLSLYNTLLEGLCARGLCAHLAPMDGLCAQFLRKSFPRIPPTHDVYVPTESFS